MIAHRVVFTPEAQEQITEIYRYVATAASPHIAERYVSAIVSCCESLRNFPLRGSRRDDIRGGLRITNYKKRVVIAFAVEGDIVSIIGVFYGGQNYEAGLRADLDDLE